MGEVLSFIIASICHDDELLLIFGDFLEIRLVVRTHVVYKGKSDRQSVSGIPL
jgi:hypothetical protein